MSNISLARLFFAVAGICAATCGALALASAPADAASNWQVDVTPYLWLPTINAHAALQSSSIEGRGGSLACAPLCEIDAVIGPNNYLSHLNSAFMIAGDAHYRRFDVATDIINMNLSSSAGSIKDFQGPFGRIDIQVHSNVSARVTGTIWTLVGGYDVFQNRMVNTDVFTGFRSTAMTLRGDYDLGGNYGLLNRSGNFAANAGPVDWIFGIKGRVNLTKKLFVPYYLDAGAATNSSTAQEIIGIGYGERGSAELLFRNLAYTSSNTALTNARFGGPALAYTFRF
ncbi:MAG: hypothetical protein JO343_08055 [Candidatus Eremiobacteraeota bacterium]|nr:hypothetical protein [Candidatus Eremiobacteraeota bacterium]